MRIKSVLLIVFFGLIIAGCTIQSNEVSSAPIKPSFGSDIELIDGVQVGTVSWGKWNYAPEVFRVKQNVPVKLNVDLERIQGCFRDFEIPQLGISKYVTPSDSVIEFTPTSKGEYTFRCSMGMGEGKIIVE